MGDGDPHRLLHISTCLVALNASWFAQLFCGAMAIVVLWWLEKDGWT